jgi:hypothetical protein
VAEEGRPAMTEQEALEALIQFEDDAEDAGRVRPFDDEEEK